MYLPEPLIFDDFLPKRYAEEISLQISDPTFPWNYTQNLMYNQLIVHATETHPFLNKEIISLFYPLTFLLEDKCSIDFNSMMRAQVNTLLRQSNTDHHTPGVAFRFDHYAVTYFIDDADGNLTFFEERRDSEPYNNWWQEEFYLPHPEEYTVQHTVEPKKNRLVLSDGLQYRAFSPPQTIDRMLTFNFEFV